MQIQEYLDRIHYKGKPAADLKSLTGLMKAHLLNVPFENLDIHQKVWIVLDEEKIYTKIVLHQRGGFCYELNGNFQQLLVQIGFDVQIISAKVYHSDTKNILPVNKPYGFTGQTRRRYLLSGCRFWRFHL
ncbi:arylamine N-acetyltransferase family protein [Pedobacter sp. NJ-S-72]